VDEDLLKMAVAEDDKEFRRFDKRVKLNPDQVLRYDRGGDPLWVSANGLPKTIPACPYCEGPRQFEFQVPTVTV
jgi:pre-rRNA-processing protein TSR4